MMAACYYRSFPRRAEPRKGSVEFAQIQPALYAARLAGIALGILLATSIASTQPADPGKRFVHLGKDGKLAYDSDARGNRIPDFSYCGYRAGAAIPDVAVRVTVSPGKDDNNARIQAAIDHVSRLEANADGIRGAVLLLSGRHEVAGQIRIQASGVVLRGQKGATIVATGIDRRTLIEIRAGRTRIRCARVVTLLVLVGSHRLRLDSTNGPVGDQVLPRIRARKYGLRARHGSLSVARQGPVSRLILARWMRTIGASPKLTATR